MWVCVVGGRCGCVWGGVDVGVWWGGRCGCVVGGVDVGVCGGG